MSEILNLISLFMSEKLTKSGYVEAPKNLEEAKKMINVYISEYVLFLQEMAKDSSPVHLQAEAIKQIKEIEKQAGLAGFNSGPVNTTKKSSLN